jgi:hypothetical protein
MVSSSAGWVIHTTARNRGGGFGDSSPARRQRLYLPGERSIQAGRSAASSPMETTPIAAPPGAMTGDTDMPDWIGSASPLIQVLPRLLMRQENQCPSRDRSHASLSASGGPRIVRRVLGIATRLRTWGRLPIGSGTAAPTSAL